ARLAGVSIDSRTLRPGELFVAIHGPAHDGHDYVAAALESGAVAAVVAGPLHHRSRYPHGAAPVAARSAQGLGPQSLRNHGFRRKDYNERDPGGTAGRAATGPEIRGQFQ